MLHPLRRGGYCVFLKAGGKDPAVETFIAVDDVGLREVLGTLAGGGTDALVRFWVLEKFTGGLAHGLDVAQGQQESGLLVLDQLRQPADFCGDDGDAAGHRFKGRETEGFLFAGKQEEIEKRQ